MDHNLKSFGLSSAQFSCVAEILTKHLPHCQTWIFGSRATGKHKNTSDLDICILGPDPLDFRLLSDLKDSFISSPLPFRVDIVDHQSLSGELKEIIDREKRIFNPNS